MGTRFIKLYVQCKNCKGTASISYIKKADSYRGEDVKVKRKCSFCDHGKVFDSWEEYEEKILGYPSSYLL